MDEIVKTPDSTPEEKEEQPAEEQPAPAKEPPKRKRKKRTAKDYIIGLSVKLGITALALWILLTFVGGIYINHTNSSYPMIKDGDLCITLKIGTPVQGDAVAFKSGEEIRFGRVIASAGETVDIKDDRILVNGTGIFEETVYPTSEEGSKITYPYTVPEDSLFILNDFRSDNSDSRTLGGIPLSDCRGKVIFVMRRRGI